MKVIHRSEKSHIKNPYKNRIYTCPHCGIKFVIEDNDVDNILAKSIIKVDKYWYEHNMNRYSMVHFIKCECGNLVQLDNIIQGTCWCNGSIRVGGSPYTDGD